MCVGAHTINTRLYKYRISVTCDNHMQVYHIMEVVSNGKYLLHVAIIMQLVSSKYII